MPHDKSITQYKGQLVDIPDEDSLRCPYHANVMNTLDTTRSINVIIALFISVCQYPFGLQNYLK